MTNLLAVALGGAFGAGARYAISGWARRWSEGGFPAGTLSGAPKVRAMHIIAELEPQKRSLYGGAIGYFGQGETEAGVGAGKKIVDEGGKNIVCVIQEQGQQQLEDRCDGVAEGAAGAGTGAEVVVEGRMQANLFLADRVHAKCPSKYENAPGDAA